MAFHQMILIMTVDHQLQPDVLDSSPDNMIYQEHVLSMLAATEPYPCYLTQELVDHWLNPLYTNPQMPPRIPA
jgi:hypothetical protein